MILGAQFYTLREHCKDLAGLEDCLKRVADMGYEAVQISGTCAYESEWMAEKLKENGLVCPLTHFDKERIATEPEAVADFHSGFGCDNIGVGYYELINPEKVDEFIAKYKNAMTVFAAKGKKLMYHNHEGEFANFDGKTMLELLAEKTTAEELGFILDSYWVQLGGADFAQYIKRFRGRVECVHYKDCSYPRLMRAVGDGNMNWDTIIPATYEAGAKYIFVEQDNCNGLDPFDCLRKSYGFIKERLNG